MASSSAAVAGRRAATAFSAWSLKMRKAGTPRRLASARRHRRNVSSIRESGAIPGRLDGRGGAGVATAAGFRDRLPLAGAAAFFFFPLRAFVGGRAPALLTRTARPLALGGRGSFLLLALACFGGSLRRVLHHQIARHDLLQRLAVRRQARLAVRDRLAVLFKYGVGQPQKIGARHGAQNFFESVARHLPVRADFGV